MRRSESAGDGAPLARDSGASAVELVLVAPGVLVLLFLSIQAGLFFYGRVVAEHAAREGVSVLRLAQDRASADAVDGQVRDTVRAYAATVGRETLLAPTASTEYREDDGTVAVTVRGRVVSLVPGLALSVSQRAEGSVERFEGDTRRVR